LEALSQTESTFHFVILEACFHPGIWFVGVLTVVWDAAFLLGCSGEIVVILRNHCIGVDPDMPEIILMKGRSWVSIFAVFALGCHTRVQHSMDKQRASIDVLKLFGLHPT